MIYDLLIIGGGPAGASAGVYAARKKLKTVLITENFYGQSVVSAEINNWIGMKSISGMDLAKSMEEHVRSYGVEIAEGDPADHIEKINGGFNVFCKSGKSFETKTILVVSGGRHKKLGVPGEKEFEGRGMVYCATCDAPLFGGKAVAVVGAGNAGLEAARDLLSYATKVYLIATIDRVFGDLMTFDILKKDPRVEVLLSSEVKEVFGGDFLKGLKYEDKKSSEIKELAVEGVFVEIGSVPNSEFVKDLVKLNNESEIEVDAKTQATSLKGIWAAGDVTDTLYRQNIIAAGDAAKAVLNIQEFLNKK